MLCRISETKPRVMVCSSNLWSQEAEAGELLQRQGWSGLWSSDQPQFSHDILVSPNRKHIENRKANSAYKITPEEVLLTYI